MDMVSQTSVLGRTLNEPGLQSDAVRATDTVSGFPRPGRCANTNDF